MFQQIELSTYRVEVLIDNYILRADLKPRGDIVIYLNDRSWSFVPLRNAEMAPFAPDRRAGSITNELIVVNKSELMIVSILDREEADKIQLTVSHRPIVIHVGWFAIRGDIHVRADAPDQDLLDESHLFYPIRNASVFPIRPVADSPSQKVPLLLVNRSLIKAYYYHRGDSTE